MGKRIILGVIGGVAACLTPKLVAGLIDAGHEVRIVATDPALFFLNPDNLSYSGAYFGLDPKKDPDYDPSGDWVAGPEFICSKLVEFYRDKDEWPVGGYHKGNPVRHIEFREWADVLLIAPLSANTLGKIVSGICDNFLTCIARAWQKDKPLILAPAMNTEMWEDPITQVQLDALSTIKTVSIDGLIEIPRFRCVSVVDPVEKMLACGVKGKGAMADIKDIIKRVNELR